MAMFLSGEEVTMLWQKVWKKLELVKEWVEKSQSSFSQILHISLISIQSYEIKSPPWTILWFRILGIFSVENIKRLCVFMFQTWDNSQLLRRVLWISAELTIVSSLKHKNTQPLYIFNRVRVLHLDRLKEGTWLHSFAKSKYDFAKALTPSCCLEEVRSHNFGLLQG